MVTTPTDPDRDSVREDEDGPLGAFGWGGAAARS